MLQPVPNKKKNKESRKERKLPTYNHSTYIGWYLRTRFAHMGPHVLVEEKFSVKDIQCHISI